MAASSRRAIWAVASLAAAVGLSEAAPDAPVAGLTATVVDAAGKEIKLGGVRFTLGVRRLAWLGDPAAATEDGKKGPLALEIREPVSTTYTQGVVTLIPLASVEAIRYDYPKFAVAVSVKGLTEPVVGTCQYKGFSFVGLEGDAGGVKGKFTGGAVKTGVKSIDFGGAKPLPTRPADGLAWSVQIDQGKAGNPSVAARNLKALYAFPGGAEQLADALPVRNGDPIGLGGPGKPPAFQKLEVLAVDPNKKATVLGVSGETGERLALVPTGEWDKRPAALIGLVGEIDAGWKLFPLLVVHDAKPGGK